MSVPERLSSVRLTGTARAMSARFRARSARAGAVVFRDLASGGGRLGNQLWRIAGTLGIAAGHGMDARFGPWAYDRHFSVPRRHFKWREGREATEFPTHIVPIHRTWLQDAGLWLHVEDRVRAYLAPSELARRQLDERQGDLVTLPDKIAVHVRRGDYLTAADRHPVCGQRYYRSALERLPEGNVVVFSDDPAWCAENLAWMRPRAIVGYPVGSRREDHLSGNPDHLDLFLMAQCDHHVIANSSFSWWGAFLSGNPSPIHPLGWFGPRFADIDPTLMFLPGWTGLDENGDRGGMPEPGGATMLVRQAMS